MKKLRLSNIFHWLYAILMFLPFILLVCNIVIMFGNYQPIVDGSWEYINDYVNQTLYYFTPFHLFEDGMLSDVHNAIENVFGFFVGFDSDGTIPENCIRALFVYWVEVSLLYLMFDLAMFMINLAHRWIDKGGLE